MGKRSPEVPGWSKLGLQWDEFEVLVREMEASPAFLEAYGGDTSYPCPNPSVLYDIGSVLYVSQPPGGTIMSALDPGEERPGFQRLIDDFYACALEALRSLTKPDDFIFALDCEYEGYRFWPHRAVAGEPWPLRVPGPEAYYSLYAPLDYAWGFFVGWSQVEVFGRPLLDEFERHKPEVLSKVVAVDGVELPAPPLTELEQQRLERQLAEDRVDQILFRTEINYAICPEGPWTPELERLHTQSSSALTTDRI